MARAHYETYLLDSEGRPIGGASVTVHEPETLTLISETIYAEDEPDVTTKTNPFTADADGRIVIYLANPKVVDLLVEKTGYEDRTVRATAHQLTASTLVFKDSGITMNQRAGVNFTDGFVLTDDAISDETEVAIDFGEVGDISTQAFGDAASAGSGTEPPYANHKHGMPVDPVTAHVALPDAHQPRSHDHSNASDGTALTPASVAPSVSLTIPSSASPGQTAEGSAVWDSDDDVLTVGDGTSRKQFGKLGTAAAGASTFADAAAAGSSLEAARIDHKHGREADPVTAHAGAADPHAGYRLESADHNHEASGLQGGVLVVAVPTGAVIPYVVATPPTGWLVCDGSAVSRATYGSLFTIVSTTYGAGDGSTTFNLPDLRGRAPYGVATQFALAASDGRAVASRDPGHTAHSAHTEASNTAVQGTSNRLIGPTTHADHDKHNYLTMYYIIKT